MNIKQLLKPDWRKIMIFMMLSFVFVYVIRLPLNFEQIWWSPDCVGGCHQGVCVDCAPNYTFKPINLIFDLICWYLLSCLIIWIYDKFKKKPQ